MTSLRVLLAATLLTTTVAVPAAAEPEEYVGLLVYRTTAGAARLDLDVDLPPGQRPSYVVFGLFTASRGRLTRLDWGGATVFGQGEQTQVYGDGGRTVLCDHGVCATDTRVLSAGTSIEGSAAAGDPSMNLLFFAARAREVRYRLAGHGWAVRRVHLPSRYVAGDDVAKAGAYALTTGAEVSGEARAPGGGYGSVGIGVAPCSQTGTGLVSRGAGRVTLDGGTARATFTCPSDVGRLWAWAPRRTVWHLHGTAAGETQFAEGRLFVLDLPKTLPVPRDWPWLTR
jgi:hypothetical protein